MKLKLKIDSAASTENHWKYMKYANVHWLWWRQHLIIRDLREHCIVEVVTDSVRTVLIPSIRLRLSHLSVQALQKMISDQNFVCCDNQ
jgi:hypothetical protein